MMKNARIWNDMSSIGVMMSPRFTPPGPGVVLICSDGLWNYRPEAADLSELALPAGLTDPLTAAAGLVKFAVDRGGLDNITAVLIPIPLRTQ